MLNESGALDLTFQALADPTRRRMVAQLSRGPASVSELARPLPISLPAVLQHLQMLEASGLVRTEKTGRVRTCRIAPRALATAEGWIVEQRRMWEGRIDPLEAFLEVQSEEKKDDDD
ncbi:helix-turn-helix transcriptional regulator [Sphingosinicella sp. CPCC 101087]|uniref:ArsR/SmtB family transcription factor n=1 Tax=Sphingosinicella sp. CPCC 101087 TaxID=2497754 RepID=UPI00101B5AA1|nr:metalloregulator ArsR/SmtB family transcription factor [Sphingosinicella sp. CPCC 101087]